MFANIAKVKNYEGIFKPSNAYVSAVYIRYDSAYDIYTRTVYGVLDWLSDMGGLTESLMAIFGMFVTYFANRLFVSKIVGKVYQIRKYENIDLKGKSSKNALNDDSENNTSRLPIKDSGGLSHAANL